jgi:hypothetical protein
VKYNVNLKRKREQPAKRVQKLSVIPETIIDMQRKYSGIEYSENIQKKM